MVSQECSKNCSRNFDPSLNMAVVNGGFLHCTDMKNFPKNLFLRNCLSGFEIILQESGFDISRRPDCLIWAVIAMGKLPRSTICEPAGQVKKIFRSLLQIPVVFGL